MSEEAQVNPGHARGFLGAVERIGNKLPDPAMLFVGLLGIVWLLSWALSYVTFDVFHPATGERIVVENQLAGDNFVTFLSEMVTRFMTFGPVGVVLVAMLGIGVAEHSGFITTSIRALLGATSKAFLTPMVILVGIISHSAVDAGYVLVIPLGGVIFYSAGRHPLAGIAAAFAGVSGGFSANFVPSSLDPLLQGLTLQGAQLLDPAIQVNTLNNYFFTTASSVLITGLGWYITDRIIEPRVSRTPIDGDDLPGPVAGVTYKILQHADGGLQPLKQGFSWPAFFVTFVWAAAMGMLPLAAALFVAQSLLAVGLPYLVIEYFGDWGFWADASLLTLSFLTVGFMIWVGSRANVWREARLLKKEHSIVASDIPEVSLDDTLAQLKKSAFTGDVANSAISADEYAITNDERRGLRWAVIAMVAGLFLLGLTLLPTETPWRDTEGRLASFGAPIMQSIVSLIFLLFVIPGIVYGRVSGSMAGTKDMIEGMTKAMNSMAYYLVIMFFIAQFVIAFRDSGLGTLLAISGANGLEALGLPISITIVGIVVLTGVVNLFVGSASGKWGLLAPIFVPMLMTLGVSPDLTQAAYRVGDSSTNIITPLMPYFPLVVIYCQRYVKSTGIGTLAAMMMPYSLVFIVTWSIFLLAFYWLNIPLGVLSSYEYSPS